MIYHVAWLDSGVAWQCLVLPGLHIYIYIYMYIRVILGLYWDNGKENGNYYDMIG